MLPRRSIRCVTATISEEGSSGVGSVETPRAPRGARRKRQLALRSKASLRCRSTAEEQDFRQRQRI